MGRECRERAEIPVYLKAVVSVSESGKPGHSAERLEAYAGDIAVAVGYSIGDSVDVTGHILGIEPAFLNSRDELVYALHNFVAVGNGNGVIFAVYPFTAETAEEHLPDRMPPDLESGAGLLDLTVFDNSKLFADIFEIFP